MAGGYGDKQSYEGVRTFFLVPAAIGSALIVISILAFLVVVAIEQGQQMTRPASAVAMLAISLFPGALGCLAFWVANNTYVRRLVFDDQKIVVYRMWGSPKVYSWGDVVRAYGSDTAVCLEFGQQKNLELNSCLQEFEAARDGLLAVYKGIKESRNR